MTETLAERALEAARQAKCTTCDQVILGAPEVMHITYGSLSFPSTGAKRTFQLCGECGLGIAKTIFRSLGEL